ncbi:MAG TPA: benzoyl-CoA 2,3-epoxidase subunit BoxB, partial [Methylomirabilota bacterium]|nr:benzoyl-CoA 2,3-epoxidase subunit BoxB [Methylomirabilota bacterium]
LNERLRDDYIADCQRGVDAGPLDHLVPAVDSALRLPHRGFHRTIGNFAGTRISPDGRVIGEAEWEAHRADWLPTDADRAFVQSLMTPVVAPGRFAGWIAPPARGINGQPVDFEYVRAG